jgi:hypothetical protein
MNSYGVSKQFGHFVQIWNVQAESKEEAWEIAETDGILMYQTVYNDIYPDRNFVTDLNDGTNGTTIPPKLYNEWLEEAIALGMKTDEYCGLPFNDVH